MMERKILGMCRRRFWFPVLIIFFVWFLLLYFFFYSSTILGHDQERKLSNLSTDEEDHPDHRELIDSADYRENSYESSQKNSTHDKKLLSENDTKIQRGEDDDVFIWKYYPDYIYDILDHEEEIEGKIIAELKRAEFKPVKKPKKKEPPKKKINNNRIQKVIRKPERINRPATKISSPESCKNRYIHIYRIPRRFNEDLIKRCRSLSQWTDMCMYASNMGLGPQLDNFEKIYLEKGWFSTNQFMLELIFHNRMKQYDCLTDNPSLASAIFVPYYPGLDVARFLWSKNQMNMKDIDSLELAKWLRHKPEWKKMWGRDHFFVAGRITWDFRRYSNESSAWGNKLLLLPEIKNMTSLVIESSPWNNNDFAIPYPTYFHPSSDAEVFQWQDKMRGQTREFLFSFAGGPRPNLRDSIRDQIIRQCHISNKCKLLECVEKTNTCYKPDNVMKMFQDSVFCLQPPGDSLTRRSTFDSILSGCIPVFFHPGSAYVQYIWHLPKNYTKYSVFIRADEVKKGKIDIEKVLGRIPRKRVEAMREEVIKLIPKVIYADPSARLQTLDDAFDITIKGVLDRIGKIRKEMKEGKKKLSMDLVEKIAWKYNLFGTVEDHEWDPFFYKQYVRS